MEYTAHTKGHYGIEDPELKFSKKGIHEDSYKKGQKSRSTKVLKWHGNEEQTNNSVYHMLQSCGVQSVSHLKTKLITKLIFWPQQSYLDLKILVSTLPNWTVING